jgi:hypothetical protein
MDRLDLYQQFQPSAFNRRHLNAQLRTRTGTGDYERCRSRCRWLP